MSFLTVPTVADELKAYGPGWRPPANRRRRRRGKGLAGLIPLKELIPRFDRYYFPPNWPPSFSEGHLGQPVDLPSWELEKARRLIAGKERFELNGLGQPVRLPSWELMSARRMLAKKQQFELSGLGQPVRLPSWEVETARKMIAGSAYPTDTAWRERFELSGLGQPVRLPKWEIMRARKMLAAKQQFDLDGMGSTLRLDKGRTPRYHGQYGAAVGSNMATQGTWLSPSQVPAWERESAKALISKKPHFQLSGLGNDAGQGTWLSPSQVPAWERESAAQVAGPGEKFSLDGLNDYIPLKFGVEPRDDAQGTWLSPSQVQPQDLESARQLIKGRQAFGGLGQTQLPAFYQHPSLGPWGVNPQQAYAYWWAQQRALQQAAVQAPLSIWGSPGFVAPTPPLRPTQIAQPAAFNPYQEAYPTAGAAVERF